MPIAPALLARFPTDLRTKAELALNASPYLQEQLTRFPEWLDGLLSSYPYQQGELIDKIAAEIAAIKDEPSLLKAVRQIRHRETVRIAWRDLTAAADLVETLQTTSDLADALVGSVLDWWQQALVTKHGQPLNRAGVPQSMLVLGMGKLGGRELNFSSDIDLIFAFPEAGETDGRRSLDNQTFFTRVGQKLINTLGQVTGDGFAYRVDMRLRPFGEVGALALSFDAMEHYYQTHGREWERYAMVKARAMAGKVQDGQELMERLRPFVYRRYLDYGSIEQLREMKLMINREALRKGKQQDVKLGQGGIREIEFTAQVFQLMRGGRERTLQERNLLKTLAILEQQTLLSIEDARILREAYYFLRRAENRVQMWKDEQAHALPIEPEQQQFMAASLGFADWPSFMQVLDVHREQVSLIFKRIFAVDGEEDKPDEDPNQALMQLWQGNMDEDHACKLLLTWGLKPEAECWQQIQTLRASRLYQSLTELARTRLDRLMPELLAVCATQTNPAQALTRSLHVIHAIARRSGYIVMLVDHPGALEQFVKLVHASVWITAQLTQHPILLDALLDTRQLYRPLNRQELGIALKQVLGNVEPEDTGLVLERLRQFKQAQVLRVAAADITGKLPLMIVSDQLTWIAEAILEETTQHVWQTMTAKSGIPQYVLNGVKQDASMAIVAYGKLGGIELGYGSDLDLVFLHDSCGEQQFTNGEKPLESPVFFARLAQKIINALSTFTHDGRLYETDTRLRPSGASGLLVTSAEAFRQYQLEKAWIWEHQALLRARMITGSSKLRQQFASIRHEILCQPRDTEQLRQEVVNMRQKMWDALGSKDQKVFNVKKDLGGITDIEFIVQYLILAHAHQHHALVEWSDNIRQLDSLRKANILSAHEVSRLQDIYRSLRNHTHKHALQEESATVSAEYFIEERDYIKAIWLKYLGG
ncbi:bifunctional [glutamate--ammonia ligase]-adenylyl-L-tyrosine phosphorylase/[glutamate--ammonia-ligase] adenylyltransferase [uncultured Thiothrix sp.]|uniref:bifunctional [glutamate--ammonia ligase]-adenylyl-L-tyrosine phosphorylase/[glutamate--ammonia-ligase] adenylyltransferase n=1 Tax=uncultured Thiothrix sp. TaxID=223185 RepID=UPI002615CD2F|nr:bifunctional [glutamate--ammonia ligase]-adenylyl-L-tyrosine phosphorylase/[glutamate--ammonia-ligase] adenylyltransferase [uncultured Thiothrix sp.]HMT92361.1 bifunctional [glutamate--ammonia ligase]-adenylyl-L-tyrosine phosphorylase/[glutamate--ammonia-ligase] adenylyltransferase [Thiolinea sp.]